MIDPRARALVVDDDHARIGAYASRLLPMMVRSATTVEEARQALDASKYDVAFLDHDLVDFGPPDMYGYRHEFTGQDVARHIVSMPEDRRPSEVVIHSHNPDGAKAMQAILRDAGVRTRIAPFEFNPWELR